MTVVMPNGSESRLEKAQGKMLNKCTRYLSCMFIKHTYLVLSFIYCLNVNNKYVLYYSFSA